MDRKISLTNPRTPYTVLCILLGIFGFAFAWMQISNAQPSVKLSDYLQAGLFIFGAILLCIRLLVLYLLPRNDWKQWAAQHNGHYSHPANLQVQPYGMVLDMLEGTDEKTAKPFALMRTVQVFNQYGNLSTRSLAVRRFLVLAEPSPLFSRESTNGNDLRILAAKRYFMHVPSYESMTQQIANNHDSSSLVT